MNLPEFFRLPGAVAIDLDGTLLNSSGKVSSRNLHALAGCIARDMPVVIATGRPLRTTRRLLGTDLAAACSLVLSNGAVTRAALPFHGDAKSVFPQSLAGDFIAAVLDKEPDAIVTVEIDGLEFGSNRPPDWDPEALWKYNAATPDMVLTLDHAISRGASKIAVGGLAAGVSRLMDTVGRRFGRELSLVPSDGFSFLNVTMTDATKHGAIKRLIAPSGLTLDDVLAIGDDIPDLDMLRSCGIPVAMANACEEVLAVCPYRTVSNDEDGVAVVLEKIPGG